MSDGAASAAATCMRLVTGYQVSRAIYTAVSLGVFDALAEQRSSDEVAAKTGAHAPSMYRLLRALASVGVLEEDTQRRFSLTPVGQFLRRDAAGSLAPWAESIGRPYYWDAWNELPHSILTGEAAFPKAHDASVWDYREQHPEEGAYFDRAMTGMSQRLSRAVVMAFDFSRFKTVVDVGGGTGSLLTNVLRRSATVQGILFDLPDVVASRPADPPELVARLQRVGGSFFEALPKGADAYVLCSVLHNWPDEDATRILRRCREAMAPEGRVLVVESQVAPPNRGAEIKILDLNMLVMHGARERTRAEFEALFATAGLRWVGDTRTAIGMSVIEAQPA